jgi:hypothetical protein
MRRNARESEIFTVSKKAKLKFVYVADINAKNHVARILLIPRAPVVGDLMGEQLMMMETVKKGLRRGLLAAAAALPFVFGAPKAEASTVGLGLVLAIDVSGSVDAQEYALQLGGYVQAFQSVAVQNAIAAAQGGAIYATLVQWSGAGQHVQSVGWTLIDSAASSSAFATALSGVTRAFDGSTAPGDAIRFSQSLFASLPGAVLRQVIDVSGDGTENDGINTAAARTAAVNAGTTINGLAIGGAGLLSWYTNNVIGGPGAFAVQSLTFQAFGAAIQDKLVREITGTVPTPAALALFGVALFGLAAVRRRA